MVTVGPIDKGPTPYVRFVMYAEISSQDPVTNSSNVHVVLQSVNTGNSGSSFNGPGVQRALVGGAFAGQHYGDPFLPSVPSGATRWTDHFDYTIYHDANGYYNGGNGVNVTMYLDYGSVNDEYYGTTLPVPRIARRPAAPNTPTASAVGPTGMTLSWNMPDNGGAAITSMLLRRWTTPDLSGPFGQYVLGAVTSHSPNDLTPGTTYYWAVYAQNSVDYSPRSGVLTQGTLPSSAPGILVAPELDGRSARVNLTPPGSASGVTQYRTQRRAAGTTAPVTAINGASSPVVHTGLTPGGVYEFRAQAIFGAYESPWSNWVTSSMPNPNTNPGTYFDGSTTDTPALDYSWLGTVNLSKSIATGRVPIGWRASTTTSGGDAKVFQAAGGYAGNWAARAVFLRDATAANFVFGTDPGAAYRAAVEAGTTYFEGIAVWPSRSQRLRVVQRWYNDANVLLSSTVGEEVVVPAGAYTLMTANGVAPAGATGMSLDVQDVAGAGWSTWKSGDWLQLDAAGGYLGQLFEWFSGDSPDVPGFSFAWLGAANASVSARYIVPVEFVDELADPDCPPMPQPPLPPTIDTDCIDETGVWRRYTVEVPETAVRKWTSTLPTIILNTASQAERQVRIRVYANPLGLPGADAIVAGDWVAESIITYIPPNTELTLDSVSQLAWASVGGKPRVPADQLLYGTNGVPATWSELECGIAYVFTFDTSLESDPGNLTPRMLLTQRM